MHPRCMLGASLVHPCTRRLGPRALLGRQKSLTIPIKIHRAPPRPRPKATQEPPKVLSKPSSSQIFDPRPFKCDRSCFLHGACDGFVHFLVSFTSLFVSAFDCLFKNCDSNPMILQHFGIQANHILMYEPLVYRCLPFLISHLCFPLLLSQSPNATWH